MGLNVGKELAALRHQSVGELRSRYAEVFGERRTRNTRTGSSSASSGGCRPWPRATCRSVRAAAELANDADLRRRPPKSPPLAPQAAVRTRTTALAASGDGRVPPPGSTITRVYKGQTLEVAVLPTGFEFEGEVYKSLSAVAKKITGSHCNGYLFFRLAKEGGGA